MHRKDVEVHMTSIFITCAPSYIKELMRNLHTSVLHTEDAKEKGSDMAFNLPIKVINYKMTKDIIWCCVSSTWPSRNSYESFSS